MEKNRKWRLFIEIVLIGAVLLFLLHHIFSTPRLWRKNQVSFISNCDKSLWQRDSSYRGPMGDYLRTGMQPPLVAPNYCYEI